MNQFSIGGTEFGIEPGKSGVAIEVDSHIEDRAFLSINVAGSDALFADLTSAENSEWAWVLYPPRLYLSKIPISAQDRLRGEEFRLVDVGECEIGIYMMEHCDVYEVAITLYAGDALRVRGTVNVFGSPAPFSMTFGR